MFSNVLPEEQEFLMKAIQIVEEGNRSHLFDALADEYSISNTIRDTLINHYRKIIPDNCPLFHDTIPAITALRNKGFKLALLTDNPPESQKQKVETCDFEKLFDVIIYTRELNCEKPEKDAFCEVAKRLNIPLHSLAMVGDNLYKDIIGSLEAGYKLAFWITREGTFFNFESDILNRLKMTNYNFIKIDTLHQIIWSLSNN